MEAKPLGRLAPLIHVNEPDIIQFWVLPPLSPMLLLALPGLVKGLEKNYGQFISISPVAPKCRVVLLAAIRDLYNLCNFLSAKAGKFFLKPANVCLLMKTDECLLAEACKYDILGCVPSFQMKWPFEY